MPTSPSRLPSPSPNLATARIRARRFVQRYRRAIAAGLLVLAAVSAVRPLATAEAGGVSIPVLSRPLTAGDIVRDRDLAMVTVPASVLPDGALTDASLVVGQRLSVGATAGEILTPSRLLTGSVAAAGDDVVAPVRIADPQIAALLRVGDVVDVLAASSSSSSTAQARVVASAARVVGSPSAAAASSESTGARLFGSASSAFDNGGLVLLAVDPQTAAALAGAAASARLSITVRPQP